MFKKWINRYFEKAVESKFPAKEVFQSVEFLHDMSYSKMMIFIDYQKYETKDILWDYIQRDVILSLVESFFVVLHFLGRVEDSFIEERIKELDEGIGGRYPYRKNEKGEYFIEVMPGDRRLITKLQEDSLLWECGNLLHIAAFQKKQDILKEEMIDYADFVFQSFEDNVGFEIEVRKGGECGKTMGEKIRAVVESYHIEVKESPLKKE